MTGAHLVATVGNEDRALGVFPAQRFGWLDDRARQSRVAAQLRNADISGSRVEGGSTSTSDSDNLPLMRITVWNCSNTVSQP